MSNDRSSDPAPERSQRSGVRESAGDAPMEANRDASGAWQAPWVASLEHPAGAADAPVPPQQATGHYGPGYDDPTRHFGNTLPGRPDTDPPGEGGAGAAGEGVATEAKAGDRSATEPAVPGAGKTAAARSESAIREREAPQGTHHPTEDPDRPPDFTPEEIGWRPPDRAPSEEAPTSENAGLIFERS
jgi:hypothetical protein